MQFSILISTRNRADYLEKTLSKFSNIEYDKKWELVIVNNASTDHTDKILSQFSSDSSLDLVILKESKPGKSRAINKAIKIAFGQIIVFTDDDCYPTPDYLNQWERVFEENPKLGFAGGRILLYDSTDLPITVRRSQKREDFEPKSFIRTGLIQGANFALRKEVLKQINGFDISLGPGTPFICEDIDVVARASAAGWKGAYDPRPIIFHHHRIKNPKKASEKERYYHIGRGAYLLKCVLTSELRTEALKRWLRKTATQSIKTTYLELYGALYYSFVSIKNSSNT